MTSGMFTGAIQRELEEVLWDLNQAARVGMNYASIFMLMAELLMCHHQQLPEEEHQASRKVVSQFLLHIGPLVRLTYDHLITVALKSITSRRENVIVFIKWPSWNRMLSLPFRDQTSSPLQRKEKVSRCETLTKPDFWQVKAVTGKWQESEKHHISTRELTSAVKGLKAFEDSLHDHEVTLLSDNATTVAAFINRQDGIHSSSLNKMVSELLLGQSPETSGFKPCT